MSAGRAKSAPVAVAVVSWNTRELLRRCLDSLEPDVRAGLAEVFVVDNASGDGSAEMTSEEFGWATLLRAAENLGFGVAVNRAAERSTAPWLVAANADIAVEEGALARLLARAQADSAAGAVAPRLITPTGGTQHSVHAFPGVRVSLAHGLGLARVLPGLGDRLCLEGYWDAGRLRRVDWAHGAFLLLRREAFDAIGGFNTQQWMYAEDLDLAWRLSERGWAVAYEPAARVRHEVSAATSVAFGESRLTRHLLATYRWMSRVRSRPYVAAFALVNLAPVAIRWFAFAAATRLRGGAWRRRRELMRAYLGAHLASWRGSAGRRSL